MPNSTIFIKNKVKTFKKSNNENSKNNNGKPLIKQAKLFHQT
jgi:hypothetical protein